MSALFFFFVALQENDHMTKVEVFHCAACGVYLSTSSSVVHSHLTSQEHLSNTKVLLRLLQPNSYQLYRLEILESCYARKDFSVEVRGAE